MFNNILISSLRLWIFLWETFIFSLVDGIFFKSILFAIDIFIELVYEAFTLLSLGFSLFNYTSIF